MRQVHDGARSRSYLLRVAAFALCCLGGLRPAAAEDKVFDAKGFDPNRQYLRQLPFEHVDPLTGNVLLTFTDLVLPGNAGFDLRIQRTYNSKIYKTLSTTAGFTVGEDSWAGFGWTLHMGRLIFPTGGTAPLAMEMPDGRRSAFFSHVGFTDGKRITKEFWTYEPPSGTPGFHVVRLPNGHVYRFSTQQSMAGIDADSRALYVTQIADAFGNTIDVTYVPSRPHVMARIDQTLLGTPTRTRMVQFAYDETLGGVGTQSLRSMTYAPPGRPAITWTYTQRSQGAISAGYTLLDSVQPPEGPAWSFTYDEAASSPLRWTLVRVASPQGGTVSYVYQAQAFHIGSGVVFSPAVQSRTLGGRLPSGGSGTWSYSYNSTVAENVTTVTSPCGPRTVQRFLGIGSTQPHAWKLGALESSSVENGASLWEREVYSWTPSPTISDDDEGAPGSDTKVPLLQRRDVERPGEATYTTTYSYDMSPFSNLRAANFADYGRPQTTVESGQLGRTLQRTFFYFPSNAYPGFGTYIVDKLDVERLDPAGENFTTDYDYATTPYQGFVTQQTVHGLSTSYTRHASGYPASATDEDGHKTTFTYDWGVRANTITPLGFGTTQTIYPEGLVATRTQRGFTTTFDYDRLQRPTRTTPPTNVTPASNATFITYDTAGQWMRTTRGASSLTQNVDGFGRPTDTSNAVGIRTHQRYDTCGRRIYESFPFQGALDSAADVGSTYQFDPLDRVTRRTNPGGSFVLYAYEGALGNGIDLAVTDEAGRTSRQNWSAFGDPRDARLVGLTDALANTTTYAYNSLGSLTSVVPAGTPAATRTWEYYGPAESGGAHGQLERETHPESGSVSYTYFGDGRPRTRTDGLGTTRFTHDANHRLLSVDRPGSVHDVASAWDQSDNRTSLRNGRVDSSFTYDGANRMRSRQDVVGGHTLRTTYLPDANDNLARVDYPSGSRAQYTYDAENRITRVSDGGTRTFADAFQYHPSGGISSYTAGNGLVHTTTYDPQRYWITAVNSGGLVRVDYDQHDLVGNVTHTNTLAPALGAQTLGYDALDRLRTVSGAWGQSSYTYDVLGNRLSKQIGAATTTYAYAAATQRLTSASGAEPATFGYDANGNVTSDGSGTYAYAPTHMLASATVGGATTTYGYDGDDLRKVKANGTSSRFFVHNGSNQVLSEFEQVGAGPLLSVRDYVYAGSRPIASLRPPTLTVAPAALTFAAVANGAAPAAQSFTISVAGASLAWTASESASWLALAPGSGAGTPASVSVSVNPVGLAVGTYVASIVVAAPGALGSPQSVVVRFVVAGEAGLVVQPSDLRFSMVAGAANPPAQALDIIHAGPGSANWDASASATWIGLSAAEGTTPSQASVTVDGDGFEPGTYRGIVTVSAPGVAGSPRFVPIEFVVRPGPGAGCTPGAWYCETFDALAEGDLSGQGGWELPPPGAVSPQVAPDPRGVGQVMVIDPPTGGQVNSLRALTDQPLNQPGIEISMQVMASGVPSETRQIAKIEFFTTPGIAWGKTTRTFGALRFGGTLYLQYGPNIYQVLVEHMEDGRFYDVRVEYGGGQIQAYVDGVLRFSVDNPLPVKNPPMQAFGLTGWDFPGTAVIDLIEGRTRTGGLLVTPETLEFSTSASGSDAVGPSTETATRSLTRARRADAGTKPALDLRRDELSANAPLSFEANQGQTDERVEFLARGAGHTLFLTRDEAVIKLTGPRPVSGAEQGAAARHAVLRMKLEDARPSTALEGRGPLAARSHYFVGSDPARWRTGVPHFAQVAYREVRPGVDWVFYGRGRRLEHDLIVAPGSDPASLRLRFEGADDLRVDANGDLVIATAVGELRQARPQVYQEIDGTRRALQGRYVLRGAHSVGFEVAHYDRAHALVIDPVLSFASYLGGTGNEAAAAVAVDDDQGVYLAGFTDSIDFPTLGAAQATRAGTGDAFVTKLAADGSALVYSTYLGGAGGFTGAVAMAVDAQGAAYVAGETTSPQFPVLGNLQAAFGGIKDGFVTKLDPTGALTYSTYLGGTGYEEATGVAVDPAGSAHVAGWTGSLSFVGRTPTRVNLDVPPSALAEAFVAKVLPNGTDLVHLTYLNGNGEDLRPRIAADGGGNSYVVGNTWSSALLDRVRNPFPASVGAYQGTLQSQGDVFVTKLGPSGSLSYSTYVGGGGGEKAWGVAVDRACSVACSVYVSGHTQSSNFPITPGAAWSTHNGDVAGFLLNLNATGSGLLFSTFLGPGQVSQYDGVWLARDSSGYAYVWAGQANIAGFPASYCTRASNFGSLNTGPLLVRVDPDGGGVGYCAGFGLGLSTGTIGYAVAASPDGEAFVVGQTPSIEFPVTPNAFDRTLDGASDAFIAKVVEPSSELARFRFGSAAASVDEDAGQAVVLVTRTGDLTTPAGVDYATAAGTAKASVDYTETSGTLTFAPGEAALTFQVPILDDNLPETDETVKLTLSNPVGGPALGFPSSAVLTLRDDDGDLRTFTVRDRVLVLGPAWTAAVDVPWLTLSAYSGTGPSTVQAYVSADTLPPPGVYTGTIVVTANTGNSPQFIRAIWTITE